MLTRWYRAIATLGTNRTTNDFDRRLVSIVNQLALIAIIVLGIFALITGFVSHQYVRMITQLTNISLTIVPIFVWHHFGFRTIGVYSLVIGTCMSTLIDGSFGGRIEGHQYFFPILAFSIGLSFKPHERIHLIATTAIPFISWLVLEYNDFHLIPNLVHSADPAVGYLNLVASMIVSILISFLYARASWKNELTAIHASKMAGLGEMSAGMAHEINNPLAIISIALSNIKDTNVLSRDRIKFDKNIQRMTDASNRISVIVKALRTFSQSNEQDPLNTVPFARIIDSTMGLCGHRLREASVATSSNFPDDFHLYCREAEMVQIFVNLINNSIDAIGTLQERWISIEAYALNGANYLIFTDSGNGIPSDIADKIMQPFFTTKEIGRGTGLGLSVCAGILQGYGGSIEVDKTFRHTRFILKVPQPQIAQRVA